MVRGHFFKKYKIINILKQENVDLIKGLPENYKKISKNEASEGKMYKIKLKSNFWLKSFPPGQFPFALLNKSELIWTKQHFKYSIFSFFNLVCCFTTERADVEWVQNRM